MFEILGIPFTNAYFIGNLLSYAAIFSLSGLGILIAYRSGAFNLGGEGQIYFGAFLAILSGLYIFPHFSPVISKIGMFFVAFLTGGVVAVISGYLRYFFKISEFITTFLISEIFLILTNVLLRTYFHDPTYGITSTLPLPEKVLFKKILPPSVLTISPFIALFLIFLAAFILKKTVAGYEFRIFGYSPRFAFYGGIDVKKHILLPLFISGGILGFTGIIDILSREGRFIQGFSYGLGWDGIVVALLARGNPYWLFPSSLLLAYIKVLSQVGGVYGVFPSEVGEVIKAVLFLIVTIGAFSYLGEKDV